MQFKGHLYYKGYTGEAEYDEEEHYYAGHVIGLRHNGIIFEGATIEELKKDFEDGVDFYLNSCKEDGIKPETPKSGKLILRMAPEMHSRAAEKAAKQGISLNEFISRAIAAAL